MMEDDNLPMHRQDLMTKLIKQDLDPFSIEELDERISMLKQEIARVEAKKAAAAHHMSAADALFKKS